MTNKQREAIERLSLKSIISSSLELKDYPNMICFKKDVVEVLNMLKEKDKLINSNNGTINALQYALKERTEERDRKDDIISNQNKIIDLMAEYIDSNNYVDNEECQFQWDFNIKKCKGNGDCKECIKQYFERKATNNG